MPVLFETTAATGVENGAPVMQSIRIATHGYRHPSGPGYFRPDMKDANGLSVSRQIYPQRLAFGFGESDSNAAGITAMNSEGIYDALENDGFGYEGMLKLGELDTPYDELQPVFAGRVAGVTPMMHEVRFSWRSRADFLDEPVSEGRFLGDNNGVTGLEGSSSLTGLKKPRAGGSPKNIEPVAVNDALRIFAWNYDLAGSRASSHAVEDVRLAGSSWTFYADYPDEAALAAAAVPAGHYATCLAESLMMMGGADPLTAGVRMDVVIQAGAAERCASAQLRSLCLEKGKQVDEASFAALAAARPYEADWYSNEADLREIADGLLASILGWGVLSRTGAVQVGTLPDFTAAAPALTLREFGSGSAARDDVSITSIEGIKQNDDAIGAPAKSVQLTWRRNWGVLNKDSIADAVAEDTKTLLSQEYLTTVAAENSAAAIQFANAPEILHETWLSNETDALALRDVLASFYSKPVRRYEVKVTLTPQLAATISGIGDVVTIIADRFNCETGRLAFLTKETISSTLTVATYEVLTWPPQLT